MPAHKIVSRQMVSILTTFALSAGVAASPALAQSSGALGAIRGTVSDESGGKLPGVTATLTSPAIQVRQMISVTDAEGNYSFGELPVGVYRVSYELSGFT
jgi:hypothetical protein